MLWDMDMGCVDTFIRIWIRECVDCDLYLDIVVKFNFGGGGYLHMDFLAILTCIVCFVIICVLWLCS